MIYTFNLTIRTSTSKKWEWELKYFLVVKIIIIVCRGYSFINVHRSNWHLHTIKLSFVAEIHLSCRLLNSSLKFTSFGWKGQNLLLFLSLHIFIHIKLQTVNSIKDFLLTLLLTKVFALMLYYAWWQDYGCIVAKIVTVKKMKCVYMCIASYHSLH